MKKLTLKLAIALLTFFVGVALDSVWHKQQRQLPKDQPALTVCELVSNAKLYQGKTVRVRGAILPGWILESCEDNHSSSNLLDQVFSPTNEMRFVSLRFAPKNQFSEAGIPSELASCDINNRMKIVNAVLVGEFDPDLWMGHINYGFTLDDVKIESIWETQAATNFYDGSDEVHRRFSLNSEFTFSTH